MDAKARHPLTVSTPSDVEIVMTRSFDAPARLVFEAITDVHHVSRWWGCSESTDSTFKTDFRVGGKWRYVLCMGGQEHGFHGEYIEISPYTRLVTTEIYEPFPNHGTVVTVDLSEDGRRTDMTVNIRHTTKEGRDGQLASGMAAGAGQSYDRLEDLLHELQAVSS